MSNYINVLLYRLIFTGIRVVSYVVYLSNKSVRIPVALHRKDLSPIVNTGLLFSNHSSHGFIFVSIRFKERFYATKYRDYFVEAISRNEYLQSQSLIQPTLVGLCALRTRDLGRRLLK